MTEKEAAHQIALAAQIIVLDRHPSPTSRQVLREAVRAWETAVQDQEQGR
jgi:hypothetical protein